MSHVAKFSLQIATVKPCSRNHHVQLCCFCLSLDLSVFKTEAAGSLNRSFQAASLLL